MAKTRGKEKGDDRTHKRLISALTEMPSTMTTNRNSFDVLDIIEQHIDEDNQQWLKVRWRGYQEAIWEPRANLAGYPYALKKWNGNHKQSASLEKKTKKRTSSSPSPRHVSKKLRIADAASIHLDCIDELTSGAVTAAAPVHIECTPTLGDQSHVFPPTPIHPDTARFQVKLDKLKGPPVTIVNNVGDNEHSPPLEFELIERLCLGSGVPLFDPAFQCGCECPPSGCTDTKQCGCLDDIDPRQFAYKNGRVRPGRGNEISIIECNDSCSCSIECDNRVVQRGRQIPLQIFRTANKGWGLRCPRELENGTFVELYLGEVIGPDEASRRAEAGDIKGSSYLFDLDKFDDDNKSDERAINYTIDGEHCGSVARFINHSCEPNLYTYAVMSDRRDGMVYNLALFTNRKVKAFEELTFAYVDVDLKKDDEGGDLKVDPKWKCMCGARECRGWLWKH